MIPTLRIFETSSFPSSTHKNNTFVSPKKTVVRPFQEDGDFKLDRWYDVSYEDKNRDIHVVAVISPKTQAEERLFNSGRVLELHSPANPFFSGVDEPIGENFYGALQVLNHPKPFADREEGKSALFGRKLNIVDCKGNKVAAIDENYEESDALPVSDFKFTAYAGFSDFPIARGVQWVSTTAFNLLQPVETSREKVEEILASFTTIPGDRRPDFWQVDIQKPASVDARVVMLLGAYKLMSDHERHEVLVERTQNRLNEYKNKLVEANIDPEEAMKEIAAKAEADLAQDKNIVSDVGQGSWDTDAGNPVATSPVPSYYVPPVSVTVQSPRENDSFSQELYHLYLMNLLLNDSSPHYHYYSNTHRYSPQATPAPSSNLAVQQPLPSRPSEELVNYKGRMMRPFEVETEKAHEKIKNRQYYAQSAPAQRFKKLQSIVSAPVPKGPAGAFATRSAAEKRQSPITGATKTQNSVASGSSYKLPNYGTSSDTKVPAPRAKTQKFFSWYGDSKTSASNAPKTESRTEKPPAGTSWFGSKSERVTPKVTVTPTVPRGPAGAFGSRTNSPSPSKGSAGTLGLSGQGSRSSSSSSRASSGNGSSSKPSASSSPSSWSYGGSSRASSSSSPSSSSYGGRSRSSSSSSPSSSSYGGSSRSSSSSSRSSSSYGGSSRSSSSSSRSSSSYGGSSRSSSSSSRSGRR
jgi:hypothetical protein